MLLSILKTFEKKYRDLIDFQEKIWGWSILLSGESSGSRQVSRL